ncbi:hypothetical protein GCM10017786_26550 [Amycolatopsis deserti]|uniref:GNAT family N-acetyltransferase n=1 Tax=Amycolatopsis deserti TaxID=185696 RepID=A0ABQ3IVQ8_9PSEU|nr:hypothetical protein [Amycolatopsis deserti]GHE92574.1 hypothetical protein GCM10017786_26550 [Amycolatopsis deserti]
MTPTTLSAAVIESERLVLRKARDVDREGFVEVFPDPEVRAHLGGAAALRAADQPVVVGRFGFEEAGTFEAHGAQQVIAVAALRAFGAS